MTDNPTLSAVTKDDLKTVSLLFKDLTSELSPETFVLLQVTHALATGASEAQRQEVKKALQSMNQVTTEIELKNGQKAVELSNLLTKTLFPENDK